jgi:hypothetical protein
MTDDGFGYHDCPKHLINAIVELSDWFNDNYTPSENPFGNTAYRFQNDTFIAHAYSWAECSCEDQEEEINEKTGLCKCGYEPQTFNFKYKDLEVSWYKYLGRGMYVNKTNIKYKESQEILEQCLRSLRKNKKRLLVEKIKRYEHY